MGAALTLPPLLKSAKIALPFRIPLLFPSPFTPYLAPFWYWIYKDHSHIIPTSNPHQTTSKWIAMVVMWF